MNEPTGSQRDAASTIFNLPDYRVIEALDVAEGGRRVVIESTHRPHLLVDASTLAAAAGSSKSFNLVMLGAASPCLGIDNHELEKAITTYFAPKGENIVATNLKAFRLGAAQQRSKTTTR